MIISHKHKFIFFRTHKTASTSIEIALSGICGQKDVITQISKADEKERVRLGITTSQNINVPLLNYSLQDFCHSFFQKKKKKYERHMSAKEVKATVSKNIWNSYFKFSIERNPYDRMVSVYYWKGGDEKFKTIYQFLTDSRLTCFDSFEKYSIDKKIAVNQIYQYEDLEFFLKDLSLKICLKNPLQSPNYKAKSHTRKIRDYKKVLDDKSKEWIEERYANVIDRFGYEW